MPPLPSPEHLRPPARTLAQWLGAHAAGVLALVLGATSFIVVMVRQERLWSQPDFRLTIPLFVATLVPAAVALVRKERSYALPLLGLGLAAATLALGWFLVTAAVVVGTVAVILVLHGLM